MDIHVSALAVGPCLADAHDARKIGYGDWQTDSEFASSLCRKLREWGVRPTVILEPTCGIGNFAAAALDVFADSVRAVYCIEINEEYMVVARSRLERMTHGGASSGGTDVELFFFNEDVFSADLNRVSLRSDDCLLIVGNPPWVTSSKLGSIRSANVPVKSNFRKLKGLDALTGSSNFDIAESISTRMISAFVGVCDVRFAMLIKSSVAKRLVEAQKGAGSCLNDVRHCPIDASREFGTSVDACMLYSRVAPGGGDGRAEVLDLASGDAARSYGWVNGKFVADVEKYVRSSNLDGRSQLEWRSGLKHDCAKVMELHLEGARLVNGLGEIVDVEEEYVFPLLKSSDIKVRETTQVRTFVLVPQRFVGEDTGRLRAAAPRLYGYLEAHAASFERRGSSIYVGKPKFSIFGIGEYSFAPYKVVVPGLGGGSPFSLVPPINGRSVMLDDTCYLLPFGGREIAAAFVEIFNSGVVRDFLEAVTFKGKRGISKSVLMRVDLEGVIDTLYRQGAISHSEYERASSALPSRSLAMPPVS